MRVGLGRVERTEAHVHPRPSHAIRAYTAATNEDIFSTQYARSTPTQSDGLSLLPDGDWRCSTHINGYMYRRTPQEYRYPATSGFEMKPHMYESRSENPPRSLTVWGLALRGVLV